MKILVLGCKGQLGRCLFDQLNNSDHDVIFTSREQIDILNFEQTRSQIIKISPYVVINATAYTSVDKAEEDQDTANLINNLAVKNIADICSQNRYWLIHVSTDYVFDGKAKIPYREDDKTNPQGVYGETKLEGELAIQFSGCKYVIIRTAWIFSEYGNNFLKTMLHLGSELDELNIVSDQIGSPTYAQDIARSIVEIASQLKSKKDNGTYHFCGYQPCSWYQFANAIFDHARDNNLKVPSIINSIETSDYPTPAKRPPFSVLDCSKIQIDFGLYPSDWHQGISQVISKIQLNNTVS